GRLALRQIRRRDSRHVLAVGCEPFERGESELWHALADHRRGQERRVAAMERKPEQPGEAREDQQRQSKPEAPCARPCLALYHLAHARRFLVGLAAASRFGSDETRAERRLMPFASSSASRRRCLRSSSTMKRASPAIAAKVTA